MQRVSGGGHARLLFAQCCLLLLLQEEVLSAWCAASRISLTRLQEAMASLDPGHAAEEDASAAAAAAAQGSAQGGGGGGGAEDSSSFASTRGATLLSAGVLVGVALYAANEGTWFDGLDAGQVLDRQLQESFTQAYAGKWK